MDVPFQASSERGRLARLFAERIIAAGALAIETLSRPQIAAHVKHDKSPVTEADERIEAYLLEALARDLPGMPVIAEEASARGAQTTHSGSFLLIDPIDGTREFLARRQEFTVNLALIADGAPIVGAIFAPAKGRVWFACDEGYVVDAAPGGGLPPNDNWRRLRTRKPPAAGLTALVSRSHLDPETVAFLAQLTVASRLSIGSSLKFCALAEGLADVYPRFGQTMEWDTAAGDAILRAAGGATLDPAGDALRYDKAADSYRNGAFIAWGDPASATLS